jgi:N-acetylglucosaminyldiphosphoundecaprenol N-acetyl-beta-D-mannosaminyltransferase
MRPAIERPAADVLGISIDAVNMSEALAHIHEMLKSGEKGYVCCADVHGIMEAQRHPELAKAYADSAMTLPDGMPLVWMGRKQQFRHMERVCGPDLMLEVFTRPEFNQTTHYLYGGREMVAQELRDSLLRRNPEARIVGVRTPPFRALTAAEEQDLIQEIAELKPDVVWVGISCPKQELFMARYLRKLDTKLMFGVGAAFDFHTGRIRDSAPWVKRAGLQWLHRLLQDPKRLWRRYLRNNPAFIWRVALQFAGVESPARKQRSQQTAPVSVRPAVDTTIG